MVVATRALSAVIGVTMNKTNTLAIGALIAFAGSVAPALAADIGVSISIGQPGYYGRIDVEEAPRPRVIYAKPVIVERVAVQPAPIYLHVRPGHARNWNRHCHKYNACNQRVYFVNDNWYNTVYVAHHQEYGNHGDERHDGRRNGHKHRKHRNDRGDYNNHDRDDHRYDENRRDDRRG
jgi:hypothetical protein